jgi:tetratricopeptide (TPR) repeat protein/transcriptional regulator with XRE-family HTH domain
MPQDVLPDLSVTLTFLRSLLGWSQAELSEASRVSPSHLNDYERGRRQLSRERLAFLISFMGYSPASIDAALAFIAAQRAAVDSPGQPPTGGLDAHRQIESVVARFQKMAADFARSSLSMLSMEGEALRDRQQAEILWGHLKQRSPAERRALVQHGVKFRKWALCERVAAESIKKAPNHPKEALELAELALLIAELSPGEQAWRLRIQGYTWAFVSNSRRVCNDLTGAEQAIARAWKLWEAGAPGDPGLLNRAWLPWIEAVLRRDQRRFPGALKRIGEALEFDGGELRGEILLSKARIHETLGDPEASTAALLEAEPLIDPSRETRNAWVLRINLGVDLCQLGRFGEAELRLPEVRALAERLGEELDLTRVVWLEGRVAAGLGRAAEARAAFEQARWVFSQRELAYDYALVSLDLALLLLQAGATVEVRALAEEMLWIYRTQKVERESLAALRVFCDAARREAATAQLAQRVLRFLHRAQYDPELRFASTENFTESG